MNEIPDTQSVSLESLTQDPKNTRRHPEENLLAIQESLRRFGQVLPLVVRQGVVVGGNGTLEAMRRLGWEYVKVVEFSGSLDSARALAIALNRTSELARWDTDQLGATLVDLDGLGFSPEDLGFDEKALEGIFELEKVEFYAKKGGVVEQDEVPEPPKAPVTRLGDVWTLGRHRVVCGDCLESEVPGGLVLMVTDPPYGVEYDPKWREVLGGANRVREKVEGDHRVDWSELWSKLGDCAAYAWCASGPFQLVAGAALEVGGFELRQQLVWVKPYPPFSRSRYSYRHESCWFAVKGNAPSWAGDSKQTSVIEAVQPGDPYGRGEERHGHPTQKPIECMARPIRNHEGNVYDPFLGSGTTLIAAEQLNRTCYGVEISPAYCDVIVERWQNLTGGKATR